MICLLVCPEPQAWMDKLPVLQRLARENRNSARMFKFVADPPTTTLQRLKVGVCTSPKCECNLVILSDIAGSNWPLFTPSVPQRSSLIPDMLPASEVTHGCNNTCRGCRPN